MKKSTVCLLSLVLLHANGVFADVVTEAVPDTTAGKGFGGIAGFMVGAAAGGPIGAVVGALVGGWSVAQVQELTGFHGTAYRVEQRDGKSRVVRSPNQSWKTGDVVTVRGGRLAPAAYSTE